MMRRSFLDLNQLRYLEELRLGEDFALYARALAAGAIFRVIPSRTYVSIIRSNSISGNHSKRDLECLRDSSRVAATVADADEARRESLLGNTLNLSTHVYSGLTSLTP